MEQLDINTEELRKQYNRDATNFNRAEVEEKGLINMPDCPAKFEQIRESLGVNAMPGATGANRYGACFSSSMASTERPNGLPGME